MGMKPHWTMIGLLALGIATPGCQNQRPRPQTPQARTNGMPTGATTGVSAQQKTFQNQQAPTAYGVPAPSPQFPVGAQPGVPAGPAGFSQQPTTPVTAPTHPGRPGFGQSAVPAAAPGIAPSGYNTNPLPPPAPVNPTSYQTQYQQPSRPAHTPAAVPQQDPLLPAVAPIQTTSPTSMVVPQAPPAPLANVVPPAPVAGIVPTAPPVPVASPLIPAAPPGGGMPVGNPSINFRE